MIKAKIMEMKAEDVMMYAEQYGASLSIKEANDLLMLVKNELWSIDDKASIEQLLTKARRIVSTDAYVVLQQLFHHYF
ncbi:DUF2624 family protein [Alteribacillus sp. HJP-4]